MLVGRIGISLADAERMTWPEIAECAKSWGELEESREKGAWERMRTLAAVAISPHVKKGISAKELIPLPWDREKRPESTREEFERLAAVGERLTKGHPTDGQRNKD